MRLVQSGVELATVVVTTIEQPVGDGVRGREGECVRHRTVLRVCGARARPWSWSQHAQRTVPGAF